MTWNPSTSANVIGYRLYYGTRSRDYSASIDAGNSTSVDVPNLVDGTTYFFAVTAYTAVYESQQSDEFVHTPNPGVMLNMSMRARVQDGDAVVIAGFIIGGSSRKTVVIRGIGPSLGAAGLSDTLADPMIEVYGRDGFIIGNDNWRDFGPEALWHYSLAPGDDREAALVVTLNPGTYTAILRGKNGSSGIGLLEVYDGGIPEP